MEKIPFLAWGSIGMMSLLFLTVSYYAIRATQPKHKWGMIVFLLTLLSVFALEMRDRGCSWGNCKTDTAIPDFQTAKELACWEKDRVIWRKAFLMASVLFIILTIIQKSTLPMNTLVFVITFFMYYFWTNYDSYHHMGAFCRRSRKAKSVA